jgi:hypothetical protein
MPSFPETVGRTRGEVPAQASLGQTVTYSYSTRGRQIILGKHCVCLPFAVAFGTFVGS